jgi:hypothetical protein
MEKISPGRRRLVARVNGLRAGDPTGRKDVLRGETDHVMECRCASPIVNRSG